MKTIAKKNGTKTLNSECLITIGDAMFLAPSAAEAAKVADMLSDFESVSEKRWRTDTYRTCGDFLFFSAPHAVTIRKQDAEIVENPTAAEELAAKQVAEAEAKEQAEREAIAAKEVTK